MKYRSLEQIALEADVHPDLGMSRRERLERWAELLERQPNRRLSTIEGTEFGSRRDRAAKHADISPLTVTFEELSAHRDVRRAGACALRGSGGSGWRRDPGAAPGFLPLRQGLQPCGVCEGCRNDLECHACGSPRHRSPAACSSAPSHGRPRCRGRPNSLPQFHSKRAGFAGGELIPRTGLNDCRMHGAKGVATYAETSARHPAGEWSRVALLPCLSKRVVGSGEYRRIRPRPSDVPAERSSRP